jgi:hypothetical protein
VTLSGRDFYLGPDRSKASKDEYDRPITQWLSAGRTLAFANGHDDLMLTELLDAFWSHAEATTLILTASPSASYLSTSG